MTEFQTTSEHVMRNLDGIYLRAKIGARWENRCLTDLLWDDVERWLREKTEDLPDDLMREFFLNVTSHLHKRLRAMGDVLDIKTATDDSTEE